jgi:hypothetical protein
MEEKRKRYGKAGNKNLIAMEDAKVRVETKKEMDLAD